MVFSPWRGRLPFVQRQHAHDQRNHLVVLRFFLLVSQGRI
jgi:hypothetical protein